MHGVPENLIAIAKARFLSRAPDLIDVMERMDSAGKTAGLDPRPSTPGIHRSTDA